MKAVEGTWLALCTDAASWGTEKFRASGFPKPTVFHIVSWSSIRHLCNFNRKGLSGDRESQKPILGLLLILEVHTLVCGPTLGHVSCIYSFLTALSLFCVHHRSQILPAFTSKACFLLESDLEPQSTSLVFASLVALG